MLTNDVVCFEQLGPDINGDNLRHDSDVVIILSAAILT